MTSFAFIFGLLPLGLPAFRRRRRRVLGSTSSRNDRGLSIAIFLIPVTFYVIERVAAGRKQKSLTRAVANRKRNPSPPLRCKPVASEKGLVAPV